MTHSCFRLLMKMIIECRPFGKQSVLKRRDPSVNIENSMMQSLTLQLFKDLHGRRLRMNYAVDRARGGGLEVQVVMEVVTIMEMEEITPVVLVVEKLDMVLLVVVVMLKVYKMEILGSETFQMETVLTMEILEVLAVVVALMVGFIGYKLVMSYTLTRILSKKAMKSYALKTATA
ncbi:hypothetical protein Pint_28975 [Pistacia integerrima]|uniref:Uncharacterized protein n=1 Tax=Pistacia integerrima TaxID=434235 RepID=A0ACC0X1Q8_9ROSI|nr:hypothetical protein Pint_28975 [Pistacia integerrima]